VTPIREIARGKWRSILQALGVDARFLTGKHGPCPFCEGRDRWRFDDKNGEGTWICTHCGAGDGLKLVMLKTGMDFGKACAEIAALVGEARAQPKRREASPGEKRYLMLGLWGQGQPVTPESATGRYLARRTGLTAFPPCLRHLERALYRGTPDMIWPAMLAAVTGPDGKIATVHRTFLAPDGQKAPVENPRRFMPGALPAGSAIRLAEPRDGLVGVAEGIETALSAAALWNVPTWATISANRLESWIAPEGVTKVVVFGDNDESFTGQSAAFRLAFRLKSAELQVCVRIPKRDGQDWNDVHAEQLLARAA
jgi:putative DNA primase/helicase